MKKLIKRIVPILLSVFMLFGVLDMPVYASSTDKEEEPATELPDPDENSDGDNTEKEGSQDLSGKDGASVQRSGFIIYVSDGSGHAVSKIVAISSMGVEPKSSSGAPKATMMFTTFGEPVNELQWETKPAWGGSPFYDNRYGYYSLVEKFSADSRWRSRLVLYLYECSWYE